MYYIIVGLPTGAVKPRSPDIWLVRIPDWLEQTASLFFIIIEK
jgi:hypothetical protein